MCIDCIPSLYTLILLQEQERIAVKVLMQSVHQFQDYRKWKKVSIHIHMFY